MYDLTDHGGRYYVGNEYCIINAMQFHNNETDDESISIAEQLYSILVNARKSKILFEILSEGIGYNQTSSCQRIIKYLIKTYNFSPKQFAISYGAQPCVQNVNYFREHCERFGWVEVPAFFFNHWEYNFSVFATEENSPYKLIDTTPRIKPKKFLCYNRNVKPHRMYLTTELIKRNLVKQGYVSNYFDFDTCEFILWALHETFPNKTPEIRKIVEENRILFPMDLGLKRLEIVTTNKFLTLNIEDLHHFNDTYFGVITESKYAKDNYSIPNRIVSDLSLDCFMFTEKTWKFIAARKPFLLVGFPNSLEVLRQMGYKTFHPYIDETYDTVDDDELRLELIANEIERLCRLSDEEMLEWQYQTNKIATYNFNRLINVSDVYTVFLPKK